MTGFPRAIKTYLLDAKWLRIIAPLVILTLYLFSMADFLSWLLPNNSANVNSDFVDRAGRFFLWLAAGLFLVFFILFRVSRGSRVSLEMATGKFRPGDLILILVPLTPIVQYTLNNQDILSTWGSLYVLVVFALFALVFIILAPVALSWFAPRKVLAPLGLALTYTIANMAALSAKFRWFEQGSLTIQLVIFAAVFLVGFLLFIAAGRKFMFWAVATFFLANTASQFFADKVAEEPASSLSGSEHVATELETLVGSRQPLSTPSIYLLVYDAYVTNETMLGYGIDNNAQEKHLRDLGFELYPQTYSVAAFTLGTMSRVLNAFASYIDSKRKGVAGDGIVHQLLKGFGYTNHGLLFTDYFFHGTESGYDSTFPPLKATHKMLTKAIFMGEFRFDVEFDNPSYEDFVKHKRNSFQKVTKSPRFIYMHDQLPGHSQNSGACRPDETDLFRERLVRANEVMKQDIDLILEKDPGALVIVAGDHGPFLTKNCTAIHDQYDVSEISRLDVQDRYGTFLAIRWPTDKFAAYDEILVLQDLFPVIFAYMFEDESFLETRINPATLHSNLVSGGAAVVNGIIQGGIHNGEPLFPGLRSR